MTLVLVHSPKGGVGSTFIAAQVAIALAEQGRDVAAIDCTGQDSLRLHFGLHRALPAATGGQMAPATLVVFGVALSNGDALRKISASDDPQSVGALFPADRVTIIDVAAGDHDLKARLMAFAALHICVLAPSAASLAILSQVEPGTATVDLANTVFVLNQADDRLRLSRNITSFLAELFGSNFIGTVRRDEAVNESLAMLQQVSRFAPASVIRTDIAVLTSAILLRCGLTPVDATATVLAR
ncbi:MAG: ATPase [Alphaproteobacteria bacterium]|nr:MAG: ATPase [Alphaproteobacteria bacterium]